MSRGKDIKSEAADTAGFSAWPDMARMIEQFKLPGVDMPALIEARRKDIEAVVQANQRAHEGMQAVARKQTEVLTQAMQAMQDTAKGAAAGVGFGDPMKRAEMAGKAWKKALADMQEIAEIARTAQEEAVARITQRAQAYQQELAKLMQDK